MSSEEKGKGKGKGKSKPSSTSFVKGKGKNKGQNISKGKGKGKKKNNNYYNNNSYWSNHNYNNNNNNNNYYYYYYYYSSYKNNWNNSWQSSWNNNNYNKGRGKGRGDKGKGKGKIICSICKKFGHTASSCYYNNNNNTNNVQQALPPPHQQYDLNNPNLDMPVSHLPRDQLPVINRNGQLTSGVPFSTASSYAPSQAASSSRYVNAPGPMVYDISFLEFEHIIDHLDTTSLQDIPAAWLKPHLILCDSGASTSVAPPSFAPHVKMEPFQNDITLKTATSQPINIIGYKDIHLISKEVEFDAGFTSRMSGRHHQQQHLLEHQQRHIHNTDLDQEDINIEAHRPRSLRSPSQPTPLQIEEHNLAHQPFRSWCPICQQTRGRPSHHRRRGEDHQSVIMFDYTFLTNPQHPPQTPSSGNRYENHITILSLIESTTGVSHAIMTHRKGITRHQLHQAKKWIITNGFSDAVIQCDAETSHPAD